MAAGRQAPVRGTQSFVGVMSAVWKRPSLTGLEVLWRWVVGAAWLAFGGVLLGSLGIDVVLAKAPLAGVSISQAVAVWQMLVPGASAIYLRLSPSLVGLCLVWLTVAALGRTAVLRRLDGTLKARRSALFFLGVLRALVLAGFWLAWVDSLRWAAGVTAVQGADAATLVPFFGLAIVLTLALYVAWALLSWPLQLAPLLAMRSGLSALQSLRVAFAASRDLRSKLVETNLVMCIVKIALLVLAMVFSASPLAFTAITTPVFLTCWWAAALLLYFVASDYFHVVRAAAYLAMIRACDSKAEN